jgi:hypothetical protein
MVSPAASLHLVRSLTELYENAEARVLASVAKYAARGLDAPDYLQRRLAEVRLLEKELRKVIADLNGDGPDEVAKAILAAHELGSADAVKELQAVGITESLSSFQTEASLRAMLALSEKVSVALQSTHLRILRQAVGDYRTIVAEAAGESLSGSMTIRQAAQAALDRFADRGITGFVDAAGRSWNLVSYAEMSMRSATGQACVQGALDYYAGNDQDLVIVSDSPEECELCAEWEGQVLSISGGDPAYPSVDDATEAGLFHPNCTHDLGLYTPGLTRPMTGTANPDGYADRQQQRYLERGIRQWKKRDAVAIDAQASAKAQAKVREWQAKLREHIDKTGMVRLRYREQISKAI